MNLAATKTIRRFIIAGNHLIEDNPEMEKLVGILTGLTGPYPYLIIFGILLICGLGVPIPEDITLFAAGLMSYYKVADVHISIVVSFLGVMLGDSIIFYLGSKYGRAIAKKGFFKKILNPQRLDEVSKRFNEKGNFVIFWARFMPGLRAPIFFSAGTLHVPYRIFLFYDGGAALLSVPAIVYSVYYFGSELDTIINTIRKVQNGIMIFIACGAVYFLAKHFWNKSKKKNAENLAK